MNTLQNDTLIRALARQPTPYTPVWLMPQAGRVPLIGFAGSPYTLACYMVEGGASEDWRTVKVMLYRRPDLLHRLLDTNSRAVSALLNAQIEAGAQIAMIFDTWGGSLPAAAYREFSLAYIE